MPTNVTKKHTLIKSNGSAFFGEAAVDYPSNPSFFNVSNLFSIVKNASSYFSFKILNNNDLLFSSFHSNNNCIRFSYANNYLMVLNNIGIVAIPNQLSISAISTPGNYKLYLGGKILAKEVVVKLQSNWPDYVFEPDYPIIKLEELENFILKNKHLPNVPSSNEIERNGISIGNMNEILLREIEILNLRIIELSKELKKLQNQ